MRTISNNELLTVSGGSESSDDPETTLINDWEGNISPSVVGGCYGVSPNDSDPNSRKVIELTLETLKKAEQVKGKIEIDFEIKKDEKSNAPVVISNIRVDLDKTNDSTTIKKSG